MNEAELLELCAGLSQNRSLLSFNIGVGIFFCALPLIPIDVIVQTNTWTEVGKSVESALAIPSLQKLTISNLSAGNIPEEIEYQIDQAFKDNTTLKELASEFLSFIFLLR